MRDHDRDYVALLNTFEYRKDVRDPYPDDRRFVAFRTGWNQGATNSRTYKASTLQRLTWQNLGYRLGRVLGPASPEEQAHAQQALARELRASKDVA